MIDHLSTYATNFDATKAFYPAVLAELDFSVQAEITLDADPDLPGRRACAFGSNGRPVFWVVEVLDASTPRNVALTARDRECVVAFHAAGLLVGGGELLRLSGNSELTIQACRCPEKYVNST